jgi:hypothetical protein
MSNNYQRVGSMWYDQEKKWFSIKIEGTFTKEQKVYVFENKKPAGEKSPQYTLHIKSEAASTPSANPATIAPQATVQNSLGF